jgi:DNA-binding transcriptional LysR family regulator
MFSQGQLRYFVTVAEEGQITRAARKLHLAQPALSQAIAQLEAELDVELLVRHPRGVTLTSAGEAFLVKARAVLAAEAETARVALSLRRAANASLAVGFIGPPPTIGTPEVFAAFAQRNPDAQVTYEDLSFPNGDTAAWIADVDVAVCHAPRREPGVSVRPLRVEPRAVVLHADHQLARRGELAVADVLDETFISYHPQVQAEWAGFHTLDDHRGAPPSRLSDDHARTSLQMLGIMSSGHAITALPYADAKLALQVLPSLVAVPLRDAAPAVVSLVWRNDSANSLLAALLDVASAPVRAGGLSGVAVGGDDV